MEYFLKSLEKVLKFRCQYGVATLTTAEHQMHFDWER